MLSANRTAEAVVQRQLAAYNARDLDALLECYADDAQLYEHPAKLLCQGTEALRVRFGARFQESNLHATLLNRMVMKNTVIDHESVARTFAEAPGTLEMILVYEIAHGRIARVTTIPGAKTLLATS